MQKLIAIGPVASPDKPRKPKVSRRLAAKRERKEERHARALKQAKRKG